MERARDLFEQALEKCPEKSCKPIFLMYAQFEEEHGLAKRSMAVLDRATKVVIDADKMEVCQNNWISWVPSSLCLFSFYSSSPFTLPKLLPTTVYPLPDPSTNVLSKSFPTNKPPKCVSDSHLWSGSWAKLIVHAPSTHMLHSSAILASTLDSGKSGIISKSRLVARIRSGRCCASSEVSKRNSTPKRDTWRHRWLPKKESRKRTTMFLRILWLQQNGLLVARKVQRLFLRSRVRMSGWRKHLCLLPQRKTRTRSRFRTTRIYDCSCYSCCNVFIVVSLVALFFRLFAIPTIDFRFAKVFPKCFPSIFLEEWLCDPSVDCFSRYFEFDRMTSESVNDFDVHME